jgi:hypothetical protein
MSNDIYAFAYRGMLARTAIESESAKVRPDEDEIAGVTARLPFELLDERFVRRGRQMAEVYAAIAAFENAVREFIKQRLLEEVGETWWEKVPAKRRENAEKRREEENKLRWHAKRGDSLLEYTDIDDLAAIIQTNQDAFLPIIQSAEWAKNIFKTVEMSRNVIMHSGHLEREDLERLRMAMRDWLAQIGG